MHRYVGAALSLAVVASVMACAGMGKSGPQTLQTKLQPDGEVPPPNVSGASPTGTASFTVNGDSVSYKVTATGLTSPVTVAHIHTGGAGVAGPVAVPLTIAAGSDPGSANGEGSFDASAIKGKNQDGSPMSMNDLLTAMRDGGAYVNVHTQNNPKGEIRGQISP